MVFKSLKTKLILSSCILIVLILGASSSFFIFTKFTELKNQIYKNSLSFAQIVTPQIDSITEEYLLNGSFLEFNRYIKSIFEKNTDLNGLTIYSYQGKILYDSNIDKTTLYEGRDRVISDEDLIKRVKDQKVSLFLENSETLFLEKDEAVAVPYAKVTNIIVPYKGMYAFEYDIQYDRLTEQVKQMITGTGVFILVGLLLAISLSYILASRIVKPIKILTQAVLTIAQGDFKKQVDIKSRDEVGMLAKSFNQMAHQLDESTKAIIFKERVSKEFELASDIQRMILPKSIPQVEGLDIAAGLIPAEAVGGDLFDFIKIDADNLMLYIGDVTGHGVPSSLVVSIANAVIYSHIEEKDMAKILCKTNAVLKAKTLPSMFLTFLMMNWDIVNKKFSYISAGHEQIIYYNKAQNKVMLMPGGGMALGMIPDVSKIIKLQNIDLQPGDVVVTYSDGIPECWRDEKEMYGMVRFKQLVANVGDLPTAESIKNAIIADVKLFANGYEQKDDITVMVMKRE